MTLSGALGAALDVGVDLPGGLDAEVVVAVVGPGKAERRATLRWEAGHLVGADEGAPSDPALTLSVAVDDVGSLVTGSLPPTVAFMRGRLKTAGDPGLVLTLLAAADTPAEEGAPSSYERWCAAQ